MTGKNFIDFLNENNLDVKEVDLIAIWNCLLFIYEDENNSELSFREIAQELSFSKEFIDALFRYAKKQNWNSSFTVNGRNVFNEED